MRSRLRFHPLLALHEVTAEWQAGLAPTVHPSCHVMVRLLDRVDLCVSPGDCVFVYHSDPAGARVLLAALEGEPRLVQTRWWRGLRHTAPGVRLRRTSIRRVLADDIRDGWRDASGPAQSAPEAAGQAPVVHLLRASRDGAASSAERQAWRQWAAATRQAGGAVVVLAPADGHMAPSLAPPRGGGTAMAPARADRIREHVAAMAASAAAGQEPDTGLRALRLHHGRVDTLHFSMPPAAYPER
ncbi:MAG: hypothetical protein K2Y26_09855 [Gemmatimonadaceae bacterium]|nr:hypothetical protein [Gemmatimonadaceae bacterium]